MTDSFSTASSEISAGFSAPSIADASPKPDAGPSSAPEPSPATKKEMTVPVVLELKRLARDITRLNDIQQVHLKNGFAALFESWRARAEMGRRLAEANLICAYGQWRTFLTQCGIHHRFIARRHMDFSVAFEQSISGLQGLVNRHALTENEKARVGWAILRAALLQISRSPDEQSVNGSAIPEIKTVMRWADYDAERWAKVSVAAIPEECRPGLKARLEPVGRIWSQL